MLLRDKVGGAESGGEVLAGPAEDILPYDSSRKIKVMRVVGLPD
jgi:hypothetical protein